MRLRTSALLYALRTHLSGPEPDVEGVCPGWASPPPDTPLEMARTTATDSAEAAGTRSTRSSVNRWYSTASTRPPRSDFPSGHQRRASVMAHRNHSPQHRGLAL